VLKQISLGGWVMGAAMTLLAACGNSGKDKPAAGEVNARAALTVTVTTPTESQWIQAVPASGNIAAWQETAVGSEIGGLRLSQVLVNVGDTVSKGQLLAALADAPVAADLASARAGLNEAQAAFAEAQANGDRARKFQASGAISQQQIMQYLTAEQTGKARIEVARARVQSEELRLKQTRIVAPDDGVISARAATVGTVPSVGQELFRLILRGRLEWRAEVSASELSRIKPGAKASVMLGSGITVSGKVRAVAPSIDPQTRNGLVYVDLQTAANAGDAKAGMFARGEIDVSQTQNQTQAQHRTLSLPQSAVLLRDGFAFVFKLGADRKVAQTKVVAGRRIGERIEIVSGLTVQDRVVETGVGFLADGDLVDVVERAAAVTPGVVPTPAPAPAPTKP